MTEGSEALLARLAVSSGFVSSAQAAAIGAEASHARPMGALLVARGFLTEEQRAALETLALRDGEVEMDGGYLPKLARLKRLVHEAEPECCRELVRELAASPIHARLARLTLRAAWQRNPAHEGLLREFEECLARPPAASATASVGPPADVTFSTFVALKQAVSSGALDRAVALERALRDDERYGRAAFQLLQKAFLSHAMASARAESEALQVTRCGRCGTAYALQRPSQQGCVVCGDEVILR